MATDQVIPQGFRPVGDPVIPAGFKPVQSVVPEGFRAMGEAKDATPRGFIANLKNPIKLMREESMPANVLTYLMSDEESTADPVTVSMSNALSDMEAQGMQDTPEYQNLLGQFNATQAIIDDGGSRFSWQALKDAAKADGGALAAEFTNALMSDPYLALTPVGWERAAAVATAKLAKAAPAIQKIGATAAGAVGASATGAAVTAPVVAAKQLAETGEINTKELADATIMAAAGASLMYGGFKGISAAAKAAVKADADVMGMKVVMGMELSPSVGAMSAATHVPASPIAKPGFTHDMVNVIGGKAVTPVREMGTVSPSFQRLARIMEPDEEVTGPLSKIPRETHSHFERVSRETGRFMGMMQDALIGHTRAFNPLGLRGAVSKDIGADIVKGLRGGTHNGVVHGAVKSLRVMLNVIADYSRAAGVDVGHIINYFPRIYRTSVLSSEEGARQFTAVLQKHGIDAVTADEILQKILNEDGILDLSKRSVKGDIESAYYAAAGRRTPMGDITSGRKDANLESARKLKDIPDDELEPFLENDLYPVLVRYIENAVKRAEWVRSFGKDGARLNNLVRSGITEAAQSGAPVRRADVMRVYDLADAMQGAYAPIQSKPIAAVNKFVAAYQLIRTLPLATLSSLSEPFIVLLRGDLTPALRAVPATVNHIAHEVVRTINKNFPKAEATRALEDVGLGLDVALTERLTAAFGGEATKATNVFFKINLLHDFTKFNRVLANETGKNMVIGYLRELSEGATGVRANRMTRILEELGVDATAGKAWMSKGGSRIDKFYENIRMAGLRFTDQVVMNPRAPNRPMWHSNPHYKLVSQLKGFQTVFGNTVVKRLHSELTKKDAYSTAVMTGKIATIVPLMLLTAAIGNEIREWIKYGEKGNPKFRDESPQQKLVRAVDRTGFTGVMQFGLDATLAHRFGSTGLGAVLGPTASQFEEAAFKGLGQLKETGNTSVLQNATINAIPFANANKGARETLKEMMFD